MMKLEHRQINGKYAWQICDDCRLKDKQPHCGASEVWDCQRRAGFVYEDIEKYTVEEKSDDVTHPEHYAGMSIEPYEVALAVLSREEMIGALKFQLIKYGGRAGRKGAGDREKFKGYEADLREYMATGTLARYAKVKV